MLSCLAERRVAKEAGGRGAVPCWADGTSASAVVAGEARIPLGLVARVRSDSLVLPYLQAFLWAVQRDGWVGPGPGATGPGRAHYHRVRGPSLVEMDRDFSARVRYVQSGDVPLGRLGRIGAEEDLWFWETALSGRELDDGRIEVVLGVSGLSRVGGILCYGEELAAALTAFAWQVQNGWPDAEVFTLLLAPGDG